MTVAEWAQGARWALAGVFVVSAVAKSVRRQSLAQRASEIQGLGVPARVAPTLGIALPLVESAIALLLVLVPQRWPVLVAGAFLALMTALIARAVLRGTPVPCRCFGGLSTRPLSWWTLGRNLGFLALAALAVATPDGVGRPTWTALVCFVLAFVLVLVG